MVDEKKKDTIDLENDLSDNDDSEMTDSQKTSKLSEVYSTTIPSVDSAMESWDGSIDASYGSQSKFSFTPTHKPQTRGRPCITHSDIILLFLIGGYTQQVAGIALHPHEWRGAKNRNSTPPPGHRKNYQLSDGGFSEEDWDKHAG